MTEYHIGYIAVGSLVGLAICSLLYMTGGRSNKGIRRFGASFIVALTICLSSFFLCKFSLLLLAIYPFKILEYVQGYSNNNGKGWIKRLGISLTSIVCCAFLCWIFGNYWLLIPHAIVSLSTVFFSFKNPIFAAAEEPLVCALNNLVLVFMPFIC